jgi:TRAP-type C4-dicarboxylate transport system permease small subunit
MFKGALQVVVAVSGRIAAYTIMLMSLLILYDVIMRYGFNKATYYATEMSGYMVVAVVFLGCALTFREERHVSVGIIRMRLPPRLQLWLELITLVLSLVVFAVVTWQGSSMVLKSIIRKSASSSILGTPLFIPQIVIPVGAALLTLEIGLRIFLLGRSLMAGTNGSQDSESNTPDSDA